MKIVTTNSAAILGYVAGIHSHTARLEAIDGSMNILRSDMSAMRTDISTIAQGGGGKVIKGLNIDFFLLFSYFKRN